MTFKPNGREIYVSPVIFGGALCPMQNLEGESIKNARENVEQYTIIFEVDSTQLEAVLPEKMHSVASHLIVRIEKLKNVSWLAGRDFSRLELLTPVKIKGKVGLYNMVTWESNGDSIIYSRDAMGQAKVYARVEDTVDGASCEFKASNWTFTFLDVKLTLKKAVAKDRPHYLADSVGTFYYRYLPKTGEGFITADVEYIVLDSEKNDFGEPCKDAEAEVKWFCPKFEDAPTQYYFLEKISDMQPKQYVCAYYRDFIRVKDYFNQTIIEKEV